MNENEKGPTEDEKWDDCCDYCYYQDECDILVARCVWIRNKSCSKCNICEEFVKDYFKKASDLLRK